MKFHRTIGLLFVLILSIFMVPGAMADDPSYIIDQVEVNGITVDGDQTSVEIGDTVKVRVVVQGDVNLSESKEAKVKVWLGGYEYNDIDDTSDVFMVHAGVKHPETLYLDLPSNMEEGTYTLHVMIFDSQETVREEYSLLIEKDRHLLDLDSFDFNVEPTRYLDAGNVFNVKVRLENAGAKTEDVTVNVEVPGLGLSGKEWLTLSPGHSSTTDDLYFKIPRSAVTGDYEMIITASYSEGHEFVELRDVLHITGLQQEVVEPEDDEEQEDTNGYIEEPDQELPLEEAVVVSMDSTSQSVDVSKETAFKVSLASFDSVSRTITFKVSGAQLFGDVRIDPSFLQLEGGQKVEAYIFLKFHADAELGAHQMTLQVKADDKLLKEIQLTAIANEEKESSNPLNLDDSTLKIAFVVLVVFLIIIGLLIAFKRVRHDEFPLEPHEDRTYY